MLPTPQLNPAYRGRIAPTPTGYLHLGHAQTFGVAHARARARDGIVVYREEDLDQQRCKPEFGAAAIEDLHTFGLDWDEGPDCGGPHAPYRQSERSAWFAEVWKHLRDAGCIYPSPHSRKDVEEALSAPHDDGGEPVFPAELRPGSMDFRSAATPGDVNWRFRVPDGEVLEFVDGRCGPQRYTAGVDFGDFLIWRKDGFAAYELAVVADDHAMGITEVVRGEDLLLSTARQLLLYRALNWQTPAFFHCPLLRDAQGKRLAKRNRSLSLRELGCEGVPAEVRTTIRELAV